MTETLPAHSPLGASSAERWMNCPGSVALNKSIVKLPEPADPEYRKDGTAAHEAIAYCLGGSGCEAWEVIGHTFGEVEVTDEMAQAIQVFITAANTLAEGADYTFVEEKISSPENKMFYGTVDFAAIKEGTLYILDFKYGAGIVVDTKDNQQMMYYAYGILLKHPDVRRVVMQIIQPRITFQDFEPWEVPAEHIAEWAETVLFPAMKRTETDDTLKAGEHCRFCDAKENLACPLLKKLYEEMQQPRPTIEKYPQDKLLADWQKIDPVKMHIRAIEAEALRRMASNMMPDNGVLKLVNKKANRVWKAEAKAVFESRFGEQTLNPPEFKSPAEMEKISPAAKKLVHEYAYTPQSGYTLAPADDRRPGVVIQKATQGLAAALDIIDL